ncbi:GNAT family N-acetyltransferase [Halobacillus sp. Nhm2S1]|uniref:GNAT family N-acetyltransferase n=1 Tax=Halobacillus sp. Nhm2S1 TaxID=2866716 RepID=UPI001C73AB17|nr:GNAT family N-acetyltransferase [Halobacillus sp. Nhm2S1]
MKIDYLTNHPEKIKDVSRMIFHAFVLESGSEKTFDEVVEYFSYTKQRKLPITLVALENGDCVGTVSLFEHDLEGRENYTPWLASLYTPPEHRGRGIGQELVGKTVKVCSDLGFDSVFLRTEDASEYYKRRGWTFVETVSDKRNDRIDVFKIRCNKQDAL